MTPVVLCCLWVTAELPNMLWLRARSSLQPPGYGAHLLSFLGCGPASLQGALVQHPDADDWVWGTCRTAETTLSTRG